MVVTIKVPTLVYNIFQYTRILDRGTLKKLQYLTRKPHRSTI